MYLKFSLQAAQVSEEKAQMLKGNCLEKHQKNNSKSLLQCLDLKQLFK